MVMSVVGAVIPFVIGALADRAGIQGAFAPLSLWYLYILRYGARGTRPAEPPRSSRLLARHARGRPSVQCELALAIARAAVDRVMPMDDDSIVAAQRELWARTGRWRASASAC